jgi:hypothetical protein
MRSPVRSEVKKIVDRMSEILFATEIAFRRLHGCMPQQELNLLQSEKQLTQVFGRLLYEKRLREEELRGLREDKLKPIRSFAKFLGEDAA